MAGVTARARHLPHAATEQLQRNRTVSTVADVMTRNVVACGETSELDELMEMMTKGRFRHLPVIEDEALVGIISIGDVVRHHVAEVEMEVSAMRNYLATG